MYINTNVASLFAQNAVNATDSAMQTQEQELSTGYAINSPSDNPSGLAISNLMQGQLGGISAATQNANQALNLLQTANGGMQTDVSIVQKIQQLAVQASNGTQTTQDQQDIQSQINNLLTQVDNNAATINYNGLNVLNGNFGATTTMATTASDGMNVTLGPDSGNATAGSYAMTVTYNTTANTDTVAIVNKTSGVTVATGTYSGATTATNAVVQMVAGTSGDNTNASFVASFNAASVSSTATSDFTVTAAANPLVFQVGATQGTANEISASLGAVTSQSLGLASVSVVGQDNAQNAVTLATNALSMLTNAQGALGSQEDQLNYTISNLQTESVNLQSAQSTIMDANMATVSSQFAQSQILQQTGLQALATANALPDQVVKLLG
jgi:flagellin